MATNYKNQFSRANSVDLKLRYNQYRITNCDELLISLNLTMTILFKECDYINCITHDFFEFLKFVIRHEL